MGGPIVRTGTTPAFWANWDKAFGKATTTANKKSSGTKKDAAVKKSAKSAKAKPAGKPKKKKK